MRPSGQNGGQTGVMFSMKMSQLKGCAIGRAVSLSVLLILFAGCSEPLTDDECLLMLDRMTDKQIDQARPSTGHVERSEKMMEARKLSKSDPEFARCSSRVSRAQYECAMAAGNADQMERCLL